MCASHTGEARRAPSTTTRALAVAPDRLDRVESGVRGGLHRCPDPGLARPPGARALRGNPVPGSLPGLQRACHPVSGTRLAALRPPGDARAARLSRGHFEQGSAPRAVRLGGVAACACTCARSSTRPARSPTATSPIWLRGIVDQRHPRDSGRRLGRRRAARARAARCLLRARPRAARAGAARRPAAAPRRRGARGRRPALRDPLGHRLPPDRGRDAREPARGEDQAGRQHAHAAARQELLPDARAHGGGASCAKRAWR